MDLTPYTQRNLWGLLPTFKEADWETRYRLEQTVNASLMLRISLVVFLAICLAIIIGAITAFRLGLAEPIIQLCLITGVVLGGFTFVAHHSQGKPREWHNLSLAVILMVLIFILPPLVLGATTRPALRISRPLTGAKGHGVLRYGRQN